MAINIDEVYIQTFEANVRHLAQQSTTKLRSYITETSKQSEKHNWDRLAKSAARQKTTARMVSPSGGDKSGAVGVLEGLDWSRRVSVTETWDTGEVVELEDPIQMLIDPNAAVTQNLAMNMRRAMDDVIIKSATSAAMIGDGTTVALPAAQVLGDGTTVIALDTILAVQELFYKNDIDPDIPKVMIIGPTQQRKLMQILEVTSSDYQSVKALSTGMLPNFMGFTWVVSTRLLAPVAGQISCLAFSPRAIGMHVAADISAKVGERTDMSFAWQFYCKFSCGAVRVEDEHLVHVHLKDTLT